MVGVDEGGHVVDGGDEAGEFAVLVADGLYVHVEPAQGFAGRPGDPGAAAVLDVERPDAVCDVANRVAVFVVGAAQSE